MEQQKNDLAIPIAIVLAGVLVAGAVIFSSKQSATSALMNNPSPQGVVAQQPVPPPVDIAKVKTAGEPYVGSPNAPVTVAYWSDYQCPFCKRFEQDAIAQLVNEYVKTGKVKIVFKDFQFLGEDSQAAGLAEHAVWEVAPDKFYDWHKAMFDKQDNENGGWGNKVDILALTKSLGIDSLKVDQLMTNKGTVYQKAMDEEKAEGSAFGINGTPGTIIGKNLISGAQPYSEVKRLIEATLLEK